MKKRKNLTTPLLCLMLFAGLSLLLYPTFADYWNSFTQTRAINEYDEQVKQMDNSRFEQMWAEAQAFNAAIPQRRSPFALSEEEIAQYYELLDVLGIGTMGSIEIPSIQVSLPLYHGTEPEVLQIGIGHLEWSSLPVGGPSTHCVVSGHRGLPSARLFTDLDQLVEGDLFYLRILDQMLTYEVDQILIVEPTDTDALKIVEGQDYCTLVTCTPYSVNSHRLLIRGHRIANVEEEKVARVVADAIQIEPLIVAPIVSMPILIILLFLLLLPKDNIKTDEGDFDDE